ncbi:MAG: sigma 54-interacting transcriptional regulator [Spirochaetaceae bacterium]|nr:MAG: sigma 54-interacting transcriptional regulator [Spirochaetaceae bacterium]
MKKFSILVVDDEKEMCISLSEIINSNGYRALYTVDPKQVPVILSGENIDLIIMDVRMPVISGIDLLKRIKITNKRIPIIMISGYTSVESAVLAMKYGALNFYMKPINTTELMGEIGRVADSYWRDADNFDHRIVSRSSEMERIKKEISKVAPTDAPILLTGESGTGKELAACALHDQSERHSRPFIKVNCASLPETLLESELFGHERGSFTDAVERRLGKFEIANGGSIFLDEIGDMSLKIQPKLLRVLQDGEIQRLGGSSSISTDVRIISATNQDVDELIREGRFREDLFFRLSVVIIHIPPLRERREDIQALTDHFLEMFNRIYGKRLRSLSPEVAEIFMRHQWPGNIRELRNCLERSCIFAAQQQECLEVDLLPTQYRASADRQQDGGLAGYFDGPIPFPIIIFIVMVIFWQYILRRTKLGRYSCAVGGNKEAARLSGVPVDFYHIMTFVIGGLMAALAGIIYASRLFSATPLAGQGYELDAIASTVIGGTSVSGGEGSVIGTLVGVLLLNVVSNMFNLLGIQVYIQYLIKGVIILTVVGFDSYSRYKR